MSHGRDEVEAVARRPAEALAPPVELAGHECRTTASIGIAMYPADGSDAQTLTKNADIAMYAAKERRQERLPLLLPRDQERSRSSG